MRNINYKIFFSILAGVFILLIIYLLVDLKILGIKEEENTTPPAQIDETPIIIDVPSNDTIEENITIETNTTSQNNETIIIEPKNQTVEPKKEEKTEVVNETTEAKVKPYFEEKEFNCYEGDMFSTEVKTDLIYGKEVPTIKSLTSSSTTVATIEKHPELQGTCTGCTMTRIMCKKEGKATFKVTLSNSTTATSTIVVKKKPAGKLTFNNTEYECEVGQKVALLININGGYYDAVKSYASSNTSIATLTKAEGDDNCSGCERLELTCKSVGNTTITGTSVNGATTSATVKVTKNVGSVSYEQSNYTCNEGEVFTTVIEPKIDNSSSIPTVSNYASSNSELVSIEKSSEEAKCPNCVAVKVTCKKSGNTNLTATNSLGATTSVPITVKKADSSISFSPTTISCEAGKTKSVIVSYSPTMVDSYKIESPAVASVTKSTIQPSGNNQMSLDIICNTAGNTTMNFKLINGYSKNLTIVVY